MPASFEFLRGVLGIIGLGCAYMAGRSLAAVHREGRKLSTLYGWVIRAVLCLSAIIFRHPVDLIAMALWGFGALLFGAGYMQALHRKAPEDLSHEIFPPES